jgi:hypothetical protein
MMAAQSHAAQGGAMQASRVKHPVARRSDDRRMAAGVCAVLLLIALAWVLAAAAAERQPAWLDYYGPTVDTDAWSDIARGPGSTMFVAGVSGLTQGPGSRMTIAKFNAAGKRIWQTPTIPGVKTWVGLGASSRGYALAVDRHGDAIVAGSSSWSSGGFAVVKFSGADGGVIWWQDLHVNGYASAADVVLDRDGNAYVTGMAEIAGPSFGIYTVKLAAATGNPKWHDLYGGPQLNAANPRIAIDAARNTYVAGVVSGSGGDADWVTRKLSPSGKPLWTKRWDGAHNDDNVRGVVTKADGRAIYVCGTAENGTTNATDAVLMRYSASGRRVWVRRYTAFEADSSAEDLCFDSAGSLLLCGSRRPLDNTEAARTLLVKVTPKGRKVWLKSSPSPYNAAGDCMYWNVLAGASGSLYVSGLVEPSNTDAVSLVEKRGPSGRLVWRGVFGWAAPSQSRALKMTRAGSTRLYVTAMVEKPQVDGFIDATIMGYKP